MGAILDVATGWTLYAALVAAMGGCAAQWIIVPRVRDLPVDLTDGLRSTAGRLAFVGALLLLPALGLFFLRQLLEFRDPFVPWTEDADLLLTGTAWGATWLWGVAGAVVAVSGFGAAAGGYKAGWWVGGGAAVALGTFPAFMGHASGGDGPRTLTLAADALHMWSAGGWIGGLVFVLYAERRWRRVALESGVPGQETAAGGRPLTGQPLPSLLPTLVPLFSPLAVTCVVALIVTGTVAAWVHVPSLSAITGSPYGRTLLLKLILVGVVMGLGFLNWKKLTPRLRNSDGSDALRRAASLELLVVQAVLAVTALLVRTAPPMG